MTSVSLQEAADKLSDLIHQLKPGDELIITENDQPVAKLIPLSPADRQARQPGSAEGKLVIHREDDEHLEDFREYMQ